MTAATPPLPPSRRPSEAARRRGAGLLRIRAATRWTLVGSTVSAVLLGPGYAHALPHLPAAITHPGSDGGGSGTGTGTGSGVQPPSVPGDGAPAHTRTGAS
ncbi:hypothetical protein [Kitasatospora viridis]|uniref:Uncharacterized protein n=1 Tax=Kitasatospora viridis TaxID=281105 RepID=A0A561S983_9ACTN|nr:hypothetical protein [Kitasatospora viridis]TWF71431.1 hypothetical protein FHX73_1961 [Kitasatospora viridis]